MEKFCVAASVIAGVSLYLAVLAWVFVLPTLGVLHLLGMLK